VLCAVLLTSRKADSYCHWSKRRSSRLWLASIQHWRRQQCRHVCPQVLTMLSRYV